jgi:hypothetical protein
MNPVRVLAAFVAVASFSLGRAAQAGEAQAPPEPIVCAPGAPCAPHDSAVYRHHRLRVFAPSEVVLTTGAGVANYFGSGIRSTDPGAAWNARVTVGVHSMMALETTYNGSANVFSTPLASDLHLVSHGVDAALRLQLPYRVQPYAFGGVGYNHASLDVRGSATPATPRGTHDDQVTVPAGGGLTAYLGRHATLDARGTYRYIPDNGLTVLGDRHLHQWMAQASVGYAF